MAFAEPDLVSKLLIVQGDPFIPGDPLISAVVNYPRGPSYSVSPFIRVSRVGLIWAKCVILSVVPDSLEVGPGFFLNQG